MTVWSPNGGLSPQKTLTPDACACVPSRKAGVFWVSIAISAPIVFKNGSELSSDDAASHETGDACLFPCVSFGDLSSLDRSKLTWD